jgi:16S rRNA (cytidine1402-2'-O)-methyltransferase
MYGKLYLIPNFLSNQNGAAFIPDFVKSKVNHLKHFIVETTKPARLLLKHLHISHTQDQIKLWELNEHTNTNKISQLLEALLGHDAGLITDAGIPCVADPGWQLVRLAHTKNIQVVPLPGASSIFMALMASGFIGQQFVFHGYLPIEKPERARKIKQMEADAFKFEQTQIFMEAPYRNNQLLDDLIAVCNPNTLLCIALDITGPNEFIKTLPLKNWLQNKPNLHKQPAIFAIGA